MHMLMRFLDWLNYSKQLRKLQKKAPYDLSMVEKLMLIAHKSVKHASICKGAGAGVAKRWMVINDIHTRPITIMLLSIGIHP